MSRWTTKELSQDIKVGFADKRGPAWWGSGSLMIPGFNHFDGPVPLPMVRELLESGAVVETTIYNEIPGFDGMPFDDRNKGIARKSNGYIHGYFSKDYRPHQPIEIADMVAGKIGQTIHGSTVEVGSAGLLGNGAIAWISLEVPETVDVPAIGEQFRPHLTAVTSHDGSIATTFKRHCTRIVCDNTLDFALSELGGTVKFKHTSNSLDNMTENGVAQALGLIEQTVTAYTGFMTKLVQTTVTDAQWAEFMNRHASLMDAKTGAPKVKHALTIAEKQRAELTGLWNADPRVSPWKNTAWGVVQAVNTFTQHMGVVRGMTREERTLTNAITGKTRENDKATLNTLRAVLAMSA